MEDELEKLVKEKEQTVAMKIIPLDAFPLIGINTTTTTTIVEIPATTSVIATDASEKLEKSMEYMTL
jgi:hypothetical protein